MSDRDFLTPTEVARLLMVSPITVRQWAQKGLLEAQTTAGGHRRFPRQAVSRFARERGITLPGARPCLLVVDDNRPFNNYLTALFSANVADLDVYSAYDGFEAGRLVQQHMPDLVLLDVMMPGIDGVEVCRSLKTDPATAHIRVVAMTGYHSPELENKMLAAGAEVLLSKPFSSETVLNACGLSEQTVGTIQG
ncbi:MAG: response regulator [Pseudomonadales bacterium]